MVSSNSNSSDVCTHYWILTSEIVLVSDRRNEEVKSVIIGITADNTAKEVVNYDIVAQVLVVQ